MTKLKTKRELKTIIRRAKEDGKSVGLVTGSFTQIVRNHEILFNFAKAHADILIVCSGNDKVVCSIKKRNFPPFEERIAKLEKLKTIDYLYEIRCINTTELEPVTAVYRKLISDLTPDFIFTNGPHDKYINDKKRAADGTDTKIVDRSSPVLKPSI